MTDEELVQCHGCGIPSMECPDSVGQWIVQTRAATPDSQPATGRMQCPGQPDCPGHDVYQLYFCVNCQAEGKHEIKPKEEA